MYPTPSPLYRARPGYPAAPGSLPRIVPLPLDPGLVDQIRTATNGGYVLGTERFQKEIAAMLGRRTWRGRPGRPIKSDDKVGQQELEL